MSVFCLSSQQRSSSDQRDLPISLYQRRRSRPNRLGRKWTAPPPSAMGSRRRECAVASRVDDAVAISFRIAQAAVLMILVGCGSERKDAAPPVVTAEPDSRSPLAPESHALGACGSRLASEFVERTDFTFTYRNGEEAGQFAILESLGGGVAILDYDSDESNGRVLHRRRQIRRRRWSSRASFSTCAQRG